jgi:hypothetical protein
MIFAGFIAVPAEAQAQDAMPSPQAAAAEHSQESSTSQASGEESQFPVHSWELPAIEVEGQRASPLREEERIGSYRQPRWSAIRRFPTTRVYVVPAGKMEFEWWNRWQAPLAHVIGTCHSEDVDGDPATPAERVCEGRKLKSQYEFEMGLGHRLQLDLYLQTVQEIGAGEGQGDIHFDEEKFELRYALADWGVIPGNPTLYLEWARHNGDVDFLEAKALFGGEAAVGWHWGANVVFERGLGGVNETHYQVVAGVGRTLSDETLSLGVEAKVELSNDRSTDFAEGKELFGGPSLAWNPVPPMHVLFTPLFGVEMEGDESEGRFESWLITGWEF